MSRRTAAAFMCVTLGTVQIASAQLPMVGGAYGQTLRFVITAGDPIPTESGCSALVQILTRGRLPVSEAHVNLGPGQSTFVDVNLTRLAGAPGRRVELVPQVTVFRGDCLGGVDVFENLTGRTMASLAGLLLPATPSLSLAASSMLVPVGASLGQVVRLGVIRGFDPQPEPPRCAATLGFADAEGNTVGPSRTVDLEPGASTVLDLDPALLLPAAGEPTRTRRLVRPRLLLPASGGGDLNGCAVSVQIFERLTGWTTVAATAH